MRWLKHLKTPYSVMKFSTALNKYKSATLKRIFSLLRNISFISFSETGEVRKVSPSFFPWGDPLKLGLGLLKAIF